MDECKEALLKKDFDEEACTPKMALDAHELLSFVKLLWEAVRQQTSSIEQLESESGRRRVEAELQIKNLKDELDRRAAADDVKHKQTMSAVQDGISGISESIESIKQAVESNTSQIADNKTSILHVQEKVAETGLSVVSQGDKLTQLSAAFDEECRSRSLKEEAKKAEQQAVLQVMSNILELSMQLNDECISKASEFGASSSAVLCNNVLQQLSDAHQAREKNDENAEKVMKSMEDICTANENLREQLNKLANEVSAISTTNSAKNDDTAQQIQNLEKAFESFSAATKSVEQDAKIADLQTQNQSLSETIDSLRKQLDETREQMLAMSKKMDEFGKKNVHSRVGSATKRSAESPVKYQGNDTKRRKQKDPSSPDDISPSFERHATSQDRVSASQERLPPSGERAASSQDRSSKFRSGHDEDFSAHRVDSEPRGPASAPAAAPFSAEARSEQTSGRVASAKRRAVDSRAPAYAYDALVHRVTLTERACEQLNKQKADKQCVERELQSFFRRTQNAMRSMESHVQDSASHPRAAMLGIRCLSCNSPADTLLDNFGDRIGQNLMSPSQMYTRTRPPSSEVAPDSTAKRKLMNYYAWLREKASSPPQADSYQQSMEGVSPQSPPEEGAAVNEFQDYSHDNVDVELAEQSQL